jgi:hypothetical protein
MQSYHSVTWVSASLLLVWTTADDYICGMCGRVIQSSGQLRYAIVDGMNVRDSRVHNYPPRWNAAPSQELLVIRRNHQTGDVSLDPLRWGLFLLLVYAPERDFDGRALWRAHAATHLVACDKLAQEQSRSEHCWKTVSGPLADVTRRLRTIA